MSAERALQRSVLCKEACSAKDSVLQRSAQRRVLCKEACSAKKRALQRSVLCKEARKGECSAKKRALQRSVLCKEACSAKKRALQRSVLCKGACSAKTRKLTGPLLPSQPRKLTGPPARLKTKTDDQGEPKKTGPVKKEWQVGRDNNSKQITEAADGGARARTGADGAVVLNLRRGPGAYGCSRARTGS